MSLLVGKKAPIFKGIAVKGGPVESLSPNNFTEEISLENYLGKWVFYFFYPLDFSLVCPTEIADFGKHYEEFKKLNCEVIGCSTDSFFSHFAWRKTERDLMNLPFPLPADFTGANAKAYEVYKEETGYALRGTYIINPEGELVYSLIHPEAVGRNSNEILRVLQALQTGENTACGWSPGDKTLS